MSAVAAVIQRQPQDSHRNVYQNFAHLITGHWSVKNIKPSATGESQEIRIKVRINDNGLISVTSANIVEKKAIKEPETPQGETPAANPEGGNNMDTTEVSLDLIVFFSLEWPLRKATKLDT